MDGIGPLMPLATPLGDRFDATRSGAAGQDPQELAKEFEGLFVSMMLKQMRETSAEEGLFPGDSSDTFGGIFDMYMGQHIAQSGGIGLADTIAPAIARSQGLQP